ncbi:MAG: SGNH/GDSL hydrolase family protein [Clostridia bacterium]|nr:SGNH/GDSL hydrolase family protein [Clostridia bacterium]
MKRLISLIISFSLFLSSLIYIASAEQSQINYLVLGDSIAYGSGLKNPEEASYGKIVADTNGYEYKNHAVPGINSSELAEMIKTEEIIADIRNADIISVSIGGNDFLGDNVSDLIFDAVLEEDLSVFDETAEIFRSNLSFIINAITENNSDVIILLQTIYNPQSGKLKELYQQGADRLNAVIYRCESENPDRVCVVDIAAALDGNEENFAKDGIHPSVKGNELIASAVLKKLHSLGLCNSTEIIITEKGKDIREPILRNFIIKILIKTVEFLVKLYNFAK